MAAPAHTARVAPVGRRLEKGYRVLIAFSLDPNVSIWETEVTPPGPDAGEPIDTTTQWNDLIRSKAMQALKEYSDAASEFAYDPICYTQLDAMVGVNQAMTVHFPNGASIDFYGALRTVEYGSMSPTDMPKGTATITVTATDPETGDEEPPVYNAPGATTTEAP